MGKRDESFTGNDYYVIDVVGRKPPGGTAIVESIFMWDGVGKMAVDAISMRDYPIIQAYVMWMAIIYVAVNLLTDISYRFLDPESVWEVRKHDTGTADNGQSSESEKEPNPDEIILFCNTCGIASAGYDICKTVVSL